MPSKTSKKLSFTMDTTGGDDSPIVVRWPRNGCRPATSVEAEMWAVFVMKEKSTRRIRNFVQRTYSPDARKKLLKKKKILRRKSISLQKALSTLRNYK